MNLKHIIILLFFTLVSCNKVIPKEKMVDIFVDMFLTDQWIDDNPKIKKQADTLLVYDEIFRRYNVDYNTFIASIEYYTNEIEDYSWITETTQDKLQNLLDSHQKKYDEIKEIRAKNKANLVPYISGKFPLDSASRVSSMPLWPPKEPTLISIPYYIFKKGFKPKDSSSLRTKKTLLKNDSLSFRSDSSSLLRDSLFFRTDSSFKSDSSSLRTERSGVWQSQSKKIIKDSIIFKEIQ